jgi:transposase
MTLDDLCARLLPPAEHLTFQKLIIDEPGFILEATMISATSTCPDCHQPTARIHGRYPRTLADVPWATAPMTLRLLVRRFRCCTATCPRHTFAERLPSVAPPYARTTTRFATTQANTGLALGGAAGARHLARHGLPGSRNTLLRRVRRVALPAGPAPTIIGVDEWAWRKGQRYGTLIVDLQRGCPIDLLEDRAADTVATWLQAHPDITIVARDRAEAYAAGIRQGAPEATQVADRFHLLKNVAAALQEVFNAHHGEMAQRNQVPPPEPIPQDDDAGTAPTALPVTPTKAQQQITHNRAKRVAEYEQAHAFHQQGWTMKAISAHLGRHHRTIKKYLETSTFPERPPRRRPPSILDPYKTFLCEHWQAGCHSVKELFHAIQAQGFAGKYSIVAAYVSRLRPPQGRITRRRRADPPAPIVAVDKPLTPSRAAWLVMRREATLDDDEKQQLTWLQSQDGDIAEAITLTQDCAALVRQRHPRVIQLSGLIPMSARAPAGWAAK